jgi:hypothetical protein
MITKNTVFVLGAGASEPNGLPIGSSLRQAICEISDHHALEIFHGIAQNPEQISRFRSHYALSSGAQIDDFLLQHQSLASGWLTQVA